MSLDKLYEVLDANKLKDRLMLSMSELGINTLEQLKNDVVIQNLAKKTYKKIPLIPLRAAIKCAIGEKGFYDLVFKIRDKAIASGSMDLSWLSIGEIKTMIRGS